MTNHLCAGRMGNQRASGWHGKLAGRVSCGFVPYTARVVQIDNFFFLILGPECQVPRGTHPPPPCSPFPRSCSAGLRPDDKRAGGLNLTARLIRAILFCFASALSRLWRTHLPCPPWSVKVQTSLPASPMRRAPTHPFFCFIIIVFPPPTHPYKRLMYHITVMIRNDQKWSNTTMMKQKKNRRLRWHPRRRTMKGGWGHFNI